jgi:small subunit ribosomal protein S17
MAEEEEKQAAGSEQQAADEGEAPEADATEAAPEADAPEADATEAAPEEAPAAEEAPAEEAAEEAPAEEAAPAPAAKAEPEEPAEVLSPKEIRRRKRGAHTGEALPERSVEQRIADREAARKAKAASRRRYRQGRGKARAAATPSGEGTPKPERQPGKPKIRQGIVVSSKGEKTITVRVESARRHPAYEKVIRSSKMFHAHDERNEAGPGDTVRLVETRPMSKTKHWRLVEILERAK